MIEYAVRHIANWRPEAVEALLNAMAADGWRLVCVSEGAESFGTAFFERPVRRGVVHALRAAWRRVSGTVICSTP